MCFGAHLIFYKAYWKITNKSSIQQGIASFKQRIIFIDKRVSELETEKKVSTAARNFKEAARIATEAKSLCVEKESI